MPSRKDLAITARFDATELKLLQQHASTSFLKPSTWLRQVALNEIADQLAEARRGNGLEVDAVAAGRQMSLPWDEK